MDFVNKRKPSLAFGQFVETKTKTIVFGVQGKHVQLTSIDWIVFSDHNKNIAQTNDSFAMRTISGTKLFLGIIVFNAKRIRSIFRPKQRNFFRLLRNLRTMPVLSGSLLATAVAMALIVSSEYADDEEAFVVDVECEPWAALVNVLLVEVEAQRPANVVVVSGDVVTPEEVIEPIEALEMLELSAPVVGELGLIEELMMASSEMLLITVTVDDDDEMVDLVSFKVTDEFECSLEESDECDAVGEAGVLALPLSEVD
jgi:hypothetical protein